MWKIFYNYKKMIYRIFLKLLFLIGIVTSMDIKTEQFKMLDKINHYFQIIPTIKLILINMLKI